MEEQAKTCHPSGFHFEHRIVRRDGEVRTITVYPCVTQEENGQRQKVFGVNQDITDIKRIERSLKKANESLNLLTSITRHDISNQLLLQRGYLDILKASLSDPELLNKVSRVEESIKTVQKQVEFTKDYEQMGTIEPKWYSLEKIFHELHNKRYAREIVLDDCLHGLDILADPMFNKVIYNLVENSIRYGGKPISIKVSCVTNGDDLIIVYEDDGQGIVESDKESIFRKGFGKGTGLGLFLSRGNIVHHGHHHQGERHARFWCAVRDDRAIWALPVQVNLGSGRQSCRHSTILFSSLGMWVTMVSLSLMPERSILSLRSSSIWNMPAELFISISMSTGRSVPFFTRTLSIASAETEWMFTLPDLNGMRAPALLHVQCIGHPHHRSLQGQRADVLPMCQDGMENLRGHDGGLLLVVYALQQTVHDRRRQRHREILVLLPVHRMTDVVQRRSQHDDDLRIVEGHAIVLHHARFHARLHQQVQELHGRLGHDAHMGRTVVVESQSVDRGDVGCLPVGPYLHIGVQPVHDFDEPFVVPVDRFYDYGHEGRYADPIHLYLRPPPVR